MIETLNHLNQWLSHIKSFISPWVYAPVILVLWLMILNGVRTIFFIKAKNFGFDRNFNYADSGFAWNRISCCRFGASRYVG